MTRVLVQPDQFERRAAELAIQGKLGKPPDGTPTVPEPITGPWTSNTNLGRFMPVVVAGTKRQTILSLPEWGFPRQWTVSLGIVNEAHTAASGFSYRVEAEISFGVGGSTQTVRCDWVNGTALSLTMNAIEVTANFVGVNDAEAAQMKVSVQIARYPRPGAIAPVITIFEPTTLAAAASTGSISIPPFVGCVEAVSGDPLGADVALFYSDLTLFQLRAGVAVVNAKRGSDLRLQPGLLTYGRAREAAIINNNATNIIAGMFGKLIL